MHGFGWQIPFGGDLESITGGDCNGNWVFVCMHVQLEYTFLVTSHYDDCLGSMVYGGILYALKVDEMQSLLRALTHV